MYEQILFRRDSKFFILFEFLYLFDLKTTCTPHPSCIEVIQHQEVHRLVYRKRFSAGESKKIQFAYSELNEFDGA